MSNVLFRSLLLLLAALACVHAQQSDGLGGWHLMNTTLFKPSHPLDGMSFEWDYYTLSDPVAKFSGIICHVLLDPRAKLGGGASLPFPLNDIKVNLLPSGGSVAVVAQWADGKKTAEYISFGVNGTFSPSSRIFDAKSPRGAGDSFAKETPIRQAGRPDTMHLQGQTPELAWDLYVVQDWAERYTNIKPGGAFAAMSSVMNPLTGEEWTVDMVWPRTLITGTLTRRSTGQVVTLSPGAGGYRENSYGHWAFVLGGWDFGIGSDNNTGVMFAWQSYHEGLSQIGKISAVDMSFFDKGQLVLKHFTLAEQTLGWNHVDAGWHYDAQSTFCVPDGTKIVAQDEHYRVEATYTINDQQVALLSTTGLAKLFFIEEQFPWIQGTIYDRTQNNRVVSTFSMLGGGEFANAKSIAPIPVSNAVCGFFCNQMFATPLPKK